MNQIASQFCRWSSRCSHKTRFSKRSHTEARIIRLSNSDAGRNSDLFMPYRCEMCQGFHFGHKCSPIDHFEEERGEVRYAISAD
jgi:hypothetical protein